MVPDSACNIPATAQAYSLMSRLFPGIAWILDDVPRGQTLPLASTLNSTDGRVKAAAAIVPAGTSGGVCAFATNDTELVLDINGYFVSASDPSVLAFYPVAPCRSNTYANEAGTGPRRIAWHPRCWDWSATSPDCRCSTSPAARATTRACSSARVRTWPSAWILVAHDRARAGAEAGEPLGIEYIVSDVRDLDPEQRFDVVVAAYLLNYASTRDELRAMCDAIARCLKPGGRFVTVNSRPDLEFREIDFRPYGFERIFDGEMPEGAPFIWRIHLDDSSFDITNFHLSVATHESAFSEAGLEGVRWIDPTVSAEGEDRFPRGYWDVFLEHSPMQLLECRAGD